jgi:hypothetical protein
MTTRKPQTAENAEIRQPEKNGRQSGRQRKDLEREIKPHKTALKGWEREIKRASVLEGDAEKLAGALRDARPTIVNAISEGTQDWRKTTRQMILTQVDEALADWEKSQ